MRKSTRFFSERWPHGCKTRPQQHGDRPPRRQRQHEHRRRRTSAPLRPQGNADDAVRRLWRTALIDSAPRRAPGRPVPPVAAATETTYANLMRPTARPRASRASTNRPQSAHGRDAGQGSHPGFDGRAYGATGAGKTHTMMGDAETGGRHLLAVRDLFEQLPPNTNARVRSIRGVQRARLRFTSSGSLEAAQGLRG